MGKNKATIDYDFELNQHSLVGAKKAVSLIFGESIPKSVLDVGCGTGTWLDAFKNHGAEKCVGIDGLRAQNCLVAEENFALKNFTEDFNLANTFDLVICLEVAEHLDASFSSNFIKNLTQCGETILFSAAAPEQPGQHHVNCQWPEYWQDIFNKLGYTCYEDVRWKIWNDKQIEPWYRQNMFIAKKDQNNAGNEKRLTPVIHPDMLGHYGHSFIESSNNIINNGKMNLSWYLKVFCKAILKRIFGNDK